MLVVKRPTHLGRADRVAVALVEHVAAHDIGVDELGIRRVGAVAFVFRVRCHRENPAVAVRGADGRGRVVDAGAPDDHRQGRIPRGLAHRGNEAVEILEIELRAGGVPGVHLVLALHVEKADELESFDLAGGDLRLQTCFGRGEARHERLVTRAIRFGPVRDPSGTLGNFHDRDLIVRVDGLQHLGHAGLHTQAAFRGHLQTFPRGVGQLGYRGHVQPRTRPCGVVERAAAAGHVRLAAEDGHADHAGRGLVRGGCDGRPSCQPH